MKLSLSRALLKYKLNDCRRLLLWLRVLTLWSAITSLIILSNHFKDETIQVNLTKNYFQSVSDILNGKFLVNNPKCQIPDADAWNSRILEQVTDIGLPSFDCHNQSFFNLTYVSNNILILNEDLLKRHGYELDSSVSCCYKLITREEESKFNYTKDANNRYNVSDCFPMKKSTKPQSGFVKVICKEKNMLFEEKIFYEHYHLIAVLPEDDFNDGSSLTRKLSFWRRYSEYNNNNNIRLNLNLNNSTQNANSSHHKYVRIFEEISKQGKPPNILILGLDSTSRLNFRRYMNRTMNVFDEIIKPVEMKGFTKVGENTFPNMVPFFTSFSEDELREICYPSRWHPQDDCPYIWKKFAKYYLTAMLEDSPKYTGFNYLKTAFIKQPVDMYTRPFMLAAYENKGENPDCIRYQRSEEIIMNYIVDLATIANSRHIPYFIISWMTDLTHDNMSNLQAADQLFSQSLLQLHQKGLLQNTILLVMGDHGYRFLDIRSTSSGWFEDKLPALWIKLPDTVTASNPSWLESLKHNSNQLITPFDMHELLRDILNKYVMPEAPVLKSGKISRLRGISPFTKVPPRSCEDAEVLQNFCPCHLPVEYKRNQTFIALAAHKVVQSINSGLPEVCKPLAVGVVTASGTFANYNKVDVGDQDQSRKVRENGSDLDLHPELIIVAFKTRPGNFYFEAHVSFNKSSGEFGKVSQILRMNRKIRDTDCLSEEEEGTYELYCHCKSWFFTQIFD